MYSCALYTFLNFYKFPLLKLKKENFAEIEKNIKMHYYVHSYI